MSLAEPLPPAKPRTALLWLLLGMGAAAMVIALSPVPTRWFIRSPLFLAGLVVGTSVLPRLRATHPPAISASPSALPGSTRWRQWGWNAVWFIFWCEIVGLSLHYLGRDALRYFDFQPATFGPFWPRRIWLIAHISGGILAVTLGPIQFWTGLRRVAANFHRWTGRTYVCGVALAGGSAFYLAPKISPLEGGMISGVSMMILATAWLTSTGLALRAVLHRNIELHQRWMIRSYVLTFAFVSIRWLIDRPSLASWATPAERVPVIIWASWVLPLAATELVLFYLRPASTGPSREPASIQPS